jgi:hypothetical protein
VYLREVTLPKTLDDRSWRKYRRDQILLNYFSLQIAFRGPKQQSATLDKVWAPINPHEATIGQGAQRCFVSELLSPLVDPRRVEFQIHFIGIWRTDLTSAAPPRFLESVEAVPAALCTRSVPGGKRDGLIEEEQFGVTPLGHHDPVAAAELQNAGNPAPAFEPARNLAIAVVDYPASVAHHRPAGVGAKQFARGTDAVLKRHDLLWKFLQTRWSCLTQRFAFVRSSQFERPFRRRSRGFFIASRKVCVRQVTLQTGRLRMLLRGPLQEGHGIACVFGVELMPA